MSSERISDEKAADIEKALKKHCRFLAYVRVNALLHDCDKLTSGFLRWSPISNKEKKKFPKEEYPGHDEAFPEERQNFLASQEKLFPQYDLKPAFPPVERVALEPTLLRRELAANLIANYKHDVEFANKLKASSAEKSDLQRWFKDDKKNGLGKFSFSYTKDYTSLFTSTLFSELTGQPVTEAAKWRCDFRAGTSFYDFYVWHHSPNLWLKTKPHITTALLLFSAGTAYIDGLDTKYETESGQKGAREHHRPDIAAKQSVLIANPFGHERKVQWETAASLLRQSKAVENFLGHWQHGSPISSALALEKDIRPSFEKSIIRTGRPINDITLADHAISTAALAAAQAARLVLETSIGEVTENMYYSLPVRRKQSDWPLTSFAVFSCAINADKLDQMALELKDITALREEVKKLLEYFLTLFSEKHPVGGAVYQDQHGAHMVLPVLGNPTKRWVYGEKESPSLDPGNAPDIRWLKSDNALTNENFVSWLFATAKEELQNIEVNFGCELLIGLRYQPLTQELNKLARAIDWSRSLSSLSMMAGGTGKDGEEIQAFNYGRADQGEVTFDLCGVCGLRQGNPKNKHRKCGICEERTKPQRTQKEETGDIEDLEQASGDNRMVLLTVSFNLAQWLAETSNFGIFCHDAGRNKVKKKDEQLEILQQIADQKIEKYQRFNSFGRFRRIWRSTEIFLKELRDQIREICGHSNEANNPYLMRTILLAPQDVQIILPAAKAGKALDAVYKKFTEEFGRVSDRMPFHVSLCIFPFRVPIYLVLEAARRLRDSCLHTEQKETKLFVGDSGLLRTDILRNYKGQKRNFTYPLPMIWTQKHQPPNIMNGNDQFHANICIERDNQGRPTKWMFVGDVQDSQTAWMTDNRLAIVEISSGFSLDELAQPSEKLNPSRCHDIPLGYWPCLKELLRLESRLSETQQRRLRSVLAMREKLWHEDDLPGKNSAKKEEFLRDSIRTLWCDPSRFGPENWKNMSPDKKNLLEESCLNGTIFLALAVKKYLHNNDDKEQDHV